MKISCQLPWAPQSLNLKLRQHWSKRRVEATDLWWRLFVALGRGPWPKPFGRKSKSWQALPEARWKESGKKAVVTLTVYHPRLFDGDNLAGSLKVCIDMINRIGWLRDDSPRWAHFNFRQFYSKQKRTVIEIEYEEKDATKSKTK